MPVCPGAAHARGGAWSGAGVYAHGGLAQGPAGPATPGGPIAGIGAELQLLQIFDLALTRSFAERAGPRDFPVLLPRWQLSGGLLVVPEERFELLLQFGLGARDFADLFTVSGSTTSYHLGPRVAVPLVEHLWLTVGLRWQLPGAAAVQRRIEQAGRVPRLRQLVNFDNWEGTVGLAVRL